MGTDHQPNALASVLRFQWYPVSISLDSHKKGGAQALDTEHQPNALASVLRDRVVRPGTEGAGTEYVGF
jgi:hypothetical protein